MHDNVNDLFFLEPLMHNAMLFLKQYDFYIIIDRLSRFDCFKEQEKKGEEQAITLEEEFEDNGEDADEKEKIKIEDDDSNCIIKGD